MRGMIINVSKAPTQLTADRFCESCGYNLRGLDQCRTALMHRARAAMPGAALHEPRIGLDEAKPLQRQTED